MTAPWAADGPGRVATGRAGPVTLVAAFPDSLGDGAVVDDHRLATGAGVIVAVDAPLGDDAIAVTVMGSANVDAHSDAANAGAHEFFRRGRRCHGKTTGDQN